MATLYGSNFTSMYQTVPASFIESNSQGGKLRVAYDSYAITADLASGDIIHMVKVPKGARVYEVYLAFADLDGSGGTLDVGWAANGSDAVDADGFIVDLDVTSAGTATMSADLANAAGFGKEFAAETTITITTDGDTDATSGTIKLAVFYAVD